MLSEADLQVLESELLPALERHHLRLLAHSLRCLQQAAGEADPAAPTGLPPAAAKPPDADQLTAWARRQPDLRNDPAFIPVLVEQLGKAALQLGVIARELDRPVLSLEMADLVRWGRAGADRRLGVEPTAVSAAPISSPHS